MKAINIQKMTLISVIGSYFVSIFGFISCFGQEVFQAPVLVTGRIMEYSSNTNDSVRATIYYDYMKFGSDKIIAKIDQSGYFKFTLKSITSPANLRIGVMGHKYVFTNVMVEPGDSLFIEVDIVGAKPVSKYYGNNVVKYICNDSLIQGMLSFYNTKSRERKVEYDIAGNYLETYRLYSSWYNDMIMTLDVYKAKIGAVMYSFYKAHYTYFYLNTWETYMKLKYDRAIDELEKEKIIRSYNSYRFFDANFDKDIAALNEYFIKYLIDKERTELYFRSDGRGFEYKEIYNLLKQKYSGLLRERLLTYFLYDYKSSIDVINFQASDYENCLADAYSFVQDSKLRQLLAEKFIFRKGTAAFNFKMANLNGNIVSLDDFKGKVVLVDVWGQGCTGCALFHQTFEKDVFPKLKNENDFVVVSISTDQKKEIWLKGVEGGKYTSKEHVNLYTDGLSMSHPFVRYYNFTAIPFVILIDKNGKIFSKIDFSLSSNELLKMIQAALAES